MECIDIALDRLDFVDKASFYVVLSTKYNFSFDNISNNLKTFHQALIETYGIKHYAIDRAIIKTLHERTINGYYKLTDEVEVFVQFVKTFVEESDAIVRQVREYLESERIGHQKS